MNSKKRTIVISTLTLTLILLVAGTIAYFRRTVNGNITGQAGNLVLIVNDIDAVTEETFTVSLNRSEEEAFVMPDDKGLFDINIDSTGSTTDVAVTINIVRTSLPDNLKFYLDENYTEEITTKAFKLEKAETMTKQIKVYWYWDGSVDDANDSLYINVPLSATVNVSATIVGPNLYETLAAKQSTLDTNVNFGAESSSTNGQGLMKMSSTVNNEYPILYYRGDVTDNNVVYANKCWLIVRTTETGGTKLIYNGEVNSDGSCTNYSGVGGTTANPAYSGAYIQTSKFNENVDSPVYIGYMYNDTNKLFTHSQGWNGSTLHDANGTLDISGYRTHLADNSIDSETGRHTQNKYDSTIKDVIDTWYASNIDGKTYENLLEDTVWCNDRSVTDSELDNYLANKLFWYAITYRLDDYHAPSLACSRSMDKFTVSAENGNGDLNYPVGMLTADEMYLAGNTYWEDNNISITTYLTIPSHNYWVLSPRYFKQGLTVVYQLYLGELRNSNVNQERGIRPSLSLNKDVLILTGNGSYESPFVVFG